MEMHRHLFHFCNSDGGLAAELVNDMLARGEA